MSGIYVGLANIYAAKYNSSSGSYSDGFQVGEGMTVTIAPQYAEGSVYGDNHRVMYKKKFKNANVTLGITRLPIEAQSVFFGRTVGDDNEVVRSSKDVENYVGLGCVSNKEDEDATVTYEAAWLHKVKFSDPGFDLETEGENITFKTPSLSGSAEAFSTGEWVTTKEFSAVCEGVAWIMGLAGITEEAS
ncbi:MAG: hypothetical protein LUE31_02940 [Lachnospiraceae bacterium]|nr:hypothetical protein [Lachnospiraceae bacterium]